jgi:hypothetical protein
MIAKYFFDKKVKKLLDLPHLLNKEKLMKLTIPSGSRVAVGVCSISTVVQGGLNLKTAVEEHKKDRQKTVKAAALGALQISAGVAAFCAAVRN